MALIKCPECSTEVSSLAAACPKCAFPIASGGSAEAPEVQTIEQTSKRWKLMHIIAGVIVSIGILAMIGGFAGEATEVVLFGSLGALFGLVLYLIVGVLAWWHHG